MIRGIAIAAAVFLLLVAAEHESLAQPMMGGGGPPGRPMPDLRMMMGKPLPSPELPAGTVTVRVARKMPVNAVPGVEVVALVKNAGGDTKKRTAKTDDRGRATFEGVGAGNRFQATVVVDGETIKSSEFELPAQGGVRTMLIAGLGAPVAQGEAGQAEGESGEGEAAEGQEGGEGASGEAGDGRGGFRLGAATGTAVAAPDLPDKTLEVRALDENQHPMANQVVQLGEAAPGKEGKLEVRKATTNAQGVARFEGLDTGAAIGYAAAIDRGGMRLGTQPFAMPDKGGMRADIHALQSTADPSVIAFGSGGRIIVQMRDDILSVLEMLPIENHSNKLFDPGVGAIEVPLPKGFVNAETGEGEHKLEIRKGYGIAIHGPVAPQAATNNEITFAYTVPYHGSTYDLSQPMPNGLGATTLIMEQIGDIGAEGPGIGARQSREVSGRKYWVMPIAAVGVGQNLTFTITGLPSTDNSGRIAAGTLALLLVFAAAFFSRRPPETRQAKTNAREKLLERRETLFEQLVGVERDRRAQNGSGASGEGTVAAGIRERRNQIVAKLEAVYRDLAALDDQPAP